METFGLVDEGEGEGGEEVGEGGEGEMEKEEGRGEFTPLSSRSQETDGSQGSQDTASRKRKAPLQTPPRPSRTPSFLTPPPLSSSSSASPYLQRTSVGVTESVFNESLKDIDPERGSLLVEVLEKVGIWVGGRGREKERKSMCVRES